MRSEGFEAKSRLEAELGYGIGLRRRGIVTPCAGLSLAVGGDPHLARWNVAPGAGLGLDATRNDGGSGAGPVNAFMLRTEVRF